MVGQASRLSVRDDRQDAGPTGNLASLRVWESASGFRPGNDNGPTVTYLSDTPLGVRFIIK